MDSLISCIITTAAAIASGMVLFLLQRFFNSQKAKEEARDLEKAKDNALILRAINAVGKLAVANSIALRDGRTNGELKAALREYETVEKEMYEYIIMHYSKNI